MKYVTKRFFLVVLMLLLILTITFIFSNSMKDSNESNAQSAPIVDVVKRILDPNDKISTSTFNFIVRKTAHIIEYSMLGLWIYGLMKLFAWRSNQKTVIFTLITGFVIATSDEIIQSFTGRTNSITDVLIDLVGVSLGIGIEIMAEHALKR